MKIIVSALVAKAIIIIPAVVIFFACPTAPAEAFWGDYATEPPPEIFGVRLGDDIRNYEGMAAIKNSASDSLYVPGEKIYYREIDKGLFFCGIPVKEDVKNGDGGPRYSTYKNKIYVISFNVDKENHAEAVRKVDMMFGPCREISDGFSLEDKNYLWLNYEVAVESYRKGYFSVQWQPIQKSVPFYGCEGRRAVAFAGVALGGKVADYPFLREAYREGPEVVHYRSEVSPPHGLSAYIFSAYKGIIYGVKFVFDKSSPGFRGVRTTTLDWLDLRELPIEVLSFWGNVRVDAFRSSRTTYARLMPICWEANRARLAYYRNIKSD